VLVRLKRAVYTFLGFAVWTVAKRLGRKRLEESRASRGHGAGGR
jgi:hypothetical protein